MRKPARRLWVVPVFVVVLFAADVAAAASGDLDPTFSQDGRVLTDLRDFDSANDVAIQSDGKIVVVGSTSASGYYGTSIRPALVRYLRNGRLDSTFGQSGKVVPATGTEANAVALQRDGKIVVAGRVGSAALLARFLPNGRPDRTFSGDGFEIVDVSPGADTAHDVAIDSKGRVVAVGCRDIAGQSDFVAMRLLANGTLDPKFGIGGKARTDFEGGDDCAWSVAVQDDGAVVAGGEATVGDKTQFAAARYKPGGALDPTFAGDGTFTTDIMPLEESAYGLDLQSDGKIVLGGFSRGLQFSERHFTIVRLLSNGTPDNAFSGDGIFISPFGDSQGNDVVVLSSGKILATGWVRLHDEHRFVVERYLPRGEQDRAFGHNGRAAVDLSPGSLLEAEAAALDVGGSRIVAAGSTLDFDANFAVVALEA